MSTLVADRQLVEEPAEQPGHRPRVPGPVRTPRRRSHQRGPIARPLRAVPAPSIASGSTARVQACLVAPASLGPSWRLTERGVALVLVIALMLAAAALTVIGLTAVRVTSPSYQVSSVSQAKPVAPASVQDR